MIIGSEQLSAYLDGALPPEDMQAVEDALEHDAALQDELEALMAGDAIAQDAFGAMLDEAVPQSLISAIENAVPAQPANQPARPTRFVGLAAAAVVGALVVGSLAGYMLGAATPATQVASARGWLDDIADYHAVYAQQVRHLVEVGADEADHIETWLTNTVGVDVRIPDLQDSGLTFQGARLLVAAGKPVAQLIFTDSENRVVALCMIQSPNPADDTSARRIGAFDMVSWGAGNANIVVVGDEGRGDLEAIAQTVAQDV